MLLIFPEGSPLEGRTHEFDTPLKLGDTITVCADAGFYNSPIKSAKEDKYRVVRIDEDEAKAYLDLVRESWIFDPPLIGPSQNVDP